MLLINGILISICEKNGKRPVEEEWDSKKTCYFFTRIEYLILGRNGKKRGHQILFLTPSISIINSYISLHISV